VRLVLGEASILLEVGGLVVRKWPVVQHHRPLSEVRLEHVEVLVDALLVVEEEPLYANEQVKLDPLPQVGSFVAIDRADREVALARGYYFFRGLSMILREAFLPPRTVALAVTRSRF
jgi:hypothetical protein